MILGLIILLYLGRAFYRLAEQHQQTKWLYALLGIAVFYGSQIIIAFVGGILVTMYATSFTVDNVPDIWINLAVLPPSILFTWLFYRGLKKRWERDSDTTMHGTLDEEISFRAPERKDRFGR